MLQFVSKSLRRSRGVLVTAGLLSLLAAPAGALSVAVTYSIDVVITSTQAGGQPVLFTDLNTGPGSLTVRFNNASGLHASAGGLKVLSGSLSLDNAITLGSKIMITGNQIQMFGGGGNGSVNSLGAFALSTVGTITSGVPATVAVTAAPTASPPSPMWGKTYRSSTSGSNRIRRVAFTFDTTPPAWATRGNPVKWIASLASATQVCSTTRCARNANCSLDSASARARWAGRAHGRAARSR
jgi:hypothetical protein